VASARLGLLLELYDDARRLPARQRIINFLEIMQRLQAVDNAINCTQADISRLLGLSKVTVNQTLRKLTDQGVLRIGYGSIRFASPEHLRILSDRD
jgi:CRP-like cAMP-binding protein